MNVCVDTRRRVFRVSRRRFSSTRRRGRAFASLARCRGNESAFSAFSAFSDLRDDARVTPRRTRTRRGVTARARHKKTNARRCVERAACAARVALGAQDRLVADPFADRAHTRNRARSGTTTRRRSLGNDHDTRRKKTQKNRVVTTLARIFALLPRVERDADCA